MKRILAALVLLLGIADAAAQAPPFPATLPPNSVVGRLGISSGPAQAIPFSVLNSNLFGQLSAGLVIFSDTNGPNTAPGFVFNKTSSFGGPIAGAMGIGTTNTTTQLEVSNSGNSSNWAQIGGSGILITGSLENSASFGSQAIGSGVQTLVEWAWYRARGTPSSPSGLLNGDIIGQFQIAGRPSAAILGSFFGLGANMTVQTTGDWSGTSTPASWQFWTTPSGSTTPVRVLQIANGVSVGTTSDPGTGKISANSGFVAGGNSGTSATKTVRASGGASDCTLIFTGGILTGGSC